MKNANLTVAIIYTIIFTYLFFVGYADNDRDIMLGIFIFLPPTVINWITYNHFLKNKQQ